MAKVRVILNSEFVDSCTVNNHHRSCFYESNSKLISTVSIRIYVSKIVRTVSNELFVVGFCFEFYTSYILVLKIIRKPLICVLKLKYRYF